MIALIVYSRREGKIVHLETYVDEDLAKANDDRLRAEIDHAGSGDCEIVTLQSDSLEQLKRTHARYFKSVEELGAL